MKKIKLLQTTLITSLILTGNLVPIYAQETVTSSVTQIAAPLVNLFNMILAAAAFVFMIMIFYTAVKFGIAQGDPKGVMGAKDTLKHAIYGFIVTVGSFALVAMFAKAFGIQEDVVSNPGAASESAIQELINFIQGY